MCSGAAPGTEPKLTLYVLAIGISNYKDTESAIALRRQGCGRFRRAGQGAGRRALRKSHPAPAAWELAGRGCDKDAILDGLDWIMRAVTNTNDVAMVFLSGHGITTPDQHYRFLPYDYDPAIGSNAPRSPIRSCKDYLTKIGGKKIFFFDTCYSGDVLGGKRHRTPAERGQVRQRAKAAENGIVVFTSSTGNELSLERDEWNNGAFTKAVVEGLRGAAARPEVPVIMISDLQGYVSRRVKGLTDGNQRPMMAMPKTVEDIPIAERQVN